MDGPLRLFRSLQQNVAAAEPGRARRYSSRVRSRRLTKFSEGASILLPKSLLCPTPIKGEKMKRIGSSGEDHHAVKRSRLGGPESGALTAPASPLDPLEFRYTGAAQPRIDVRMPQEQAAGLPFLLPQELIGQVADFLDAPDLCHLRLAGKAFCSGTSFVTRLSKFTRHTWRNACLGRGSPWPSLLVKARLDMKSIHALDPGQRSSLIRKLRDNRHFMAAVVLVVNTNYGDLDLQFRLSNSAHGAQFHAPDAAYYHAMVDDLLLFECFHHPELLVQTLRIAHRCPRSGPLRTPSTRLTPAQSAYVLSVFEWETSDPDLCNYTPSAATLAPWLQTTATPMQPGHGFAEENASLTSDNWTRLRLRALIASVPGSAARQKFACCRPAHCGVLQDFFELCTHIPRDIQLEADMLRAYLGQTLRHEIVMKQNWGQHFDFILRQAQNLPDAERAEILYLAQVLFKLRNPGGQGNQDVRLTDMMCAPPPPPAQQLSILQSFLRDALYDTAKLTVLENLAVALAPAQQFQLWSSVTRHHFSGLRGPSLRSRVTQLLEIFARLPPDLHTGLVRVAAHLFSERDQLVDYRETNFDFDSLLDDISRYGPERLQSALCSMADVLLDASMPASGIFIRKLAVRIRELPVELREKPLLAIVAARVGHAQRYSDTLFDPLAPLAASLPVPARAEFIAAAQAGRTVHAAAVDRLYQPLVAAIGHFG